MTSDICSHARGDCCVVCALLCVLYTYVTTTSHLVQPWESPRNGRTCHAALSHVTTRRGRAFPRTPRRHTHLHSTTSLLPHCMVKPASKVLHCTVRYICTYMSSNDRTAAVLPLPLPSRPHRLVSAPTSQIWHVCMYVCTVGV